MMARALAWLRQFPQRVPQWWCGLRFGHDTLLQFEPWRISERCVSCGYESPGWSLTVPPPKLATADVGPFQKRMRSVT